jgi:hypothetical protein
MFDKKNSVQNCANIKIDKRYLQKICEFTFVYLICFVMGIVLVQWCSVVTVLY